MSSSSAGIVSLHGRLKVVGREAYLSDLLVLANSLSSGAGKLVFITGERGVGKTTLVREFKDTLTRNGIEFPFVVASCPAGVGKEVSFLPFRLLSEFAGSGNSVDHAFAFDLASAALACVPIVGPFLALGAVPVKKFVETMYHKDEKDRDVQFRKSADRLVGLTKKKPVVFVIDDAQWIDLSSLFLIELIARRLDESRLLFLLVLSEREAVESGILRSLKEDLAELDANLWSQLKIGNLSGEELRVLLETQFPTNNFSDELPSWLIRHTGGNPYLIVETLQHLLKRGYLYTCDGVWSAKDEMPLDIPTSIEDFVRSRLDQLSDEHQQILEGASVIGQEFDSVLLTHLLRADREQLARGLQTLCKRYHVIRPKPTARIRGKISFRYSFTDEHTKRVVYEGVQEETRCLLHKRVAENLEALGSETNVSDADQLSFHLENAEEYEKALECSKRFAIAAKSACAFGEAAKFFQRAIRCLSRLDELSTDDMEKRRIQEETLVLLFEEAVVDRFLKHWQDAVRSLEKCLTILAKLKKEAVPAVVPFEGVSLPEVHEELGFALSGLGEWQEAKKHFDNCILAVKRIHLARKFNHIAWHYSLAGRNLTQARDLIDETIRLRGLPYDYGVRGWIEYQLRDFESAIADITKAKEGIQKMRPDDIGAINVDNFHLGFVYYAKGELAMARKQLALAVNQYHQNIERLKYDKNAPSQEKVTEAINILKQLDAADTQSS